MLINPQKEFEKLLPECIKNACFSVHIPSDILEEYNDMSYKWAEDKKTFGHHYAIDLNGIHKRSSNGHLAQAALEVYLGVKFTKWNIGNKKFENEPDLKPLGLEIGVKAFKAPSNAPIIFKNSRYPEIIMCRDDINKTLYHCLGLFGPSILNYKDYVCESLVIDPNLLGRGTKIGFYRIDKGVCFKSIDELKKLAGDKWKIKNI